MVKKLWHVCQGVSVEQHDTEVRDDDGAPLEVRRPEQFAGRGQQQLSATGGPRCLPPAQQPCALPWSTMHEASKRCKGVKMIGIVVVLFHSCSQ